MRYIPVIGFLLVMRLMGVMLGVKPGEHTSREDALPPLALTALDGKTPWKQEALQGQVVAINFFASWCSPCIAEMPELSALQQQFPALHLYGVAWNDTPATLRPWLQKHGNPFRSVWLDPKGEAVMALGLKGVPETMIIDRKGVVRYRLAGQLTPQIHEEILAPLLTQLLAER